MLSVWSDWIGAKIGRKARRKFLLVVLFDEKKEQITLLFTDGTKLAITSSVSDFETIANRLWWPWMK